MTLLGGIYLFNALLFYNHFRRLSTGVITSIFGFLSWGAVFPLAQWLSVHYPAFQPPPVLWNLPKFFVAVGMILTLLENEAESGRLRGTPQSRSLQSKPMWPLSRHLVRSLSRLQ